LTILEKIFQTKREEIAVAKSKVSISQLRDQTQHSPLGFRKTIQSAACKPALIAEVKKASPSMGEIYQGEFDPVFISKEYVEAGTDCISVLTDVEYFKGSPEYLREVRRNVNVPLLRKDFICDSYQLEEAIAWGADCVLLIVAGLEPNQLRDLYQFAVQSGLDVLVEVHDERETEFAVTLGAELIGINNRDLRTFKTDLSTTQRCAKLIPSHVTLVSESALETRSDVEEVTRFGAHAVLIGTAFCGSSDIKAKVREVMGR
jgi:indole-3-glycerol phosphate synthase